MNHTKALFTALPLLGGIVFGAAFISAPSQTTELAKKSPTLLSNESLSAKRHEKGLEKKPLWAEASDVSAQEAADNQDNAGRLPGVFRGDWGETPLYAVNDRVNYEGAAYLSLADENQNQMPSLSPAYWRMVRKANNADKGNCFLPAPGAKLGECDFTERNSLKDMDLQGANLSKAQLNGELGFANLKGANLSGASVIGSLVISPDTQIDHANLSGLQSDGNNPVIAESANMNGVNFSNANLYAAQMKAANLTGAKLIRATLTGADMASSHMENADLSKTDMTYAKLSGSSLMGATLRQADLTEANLDDADFSEANLYEANLAGTNLAGTNFSGANLQGANLADTKNAESAFIDSQTDFTSAICPDGVVVDGVQATTCVGHGF
ncbi:hypothetical protein JCM14076_08770 [Methylosoma difficile]